MPSSSGSLKDKTFTSFTPDQGQHYAQHRTNYHPSVYDHIINHHKRTGEQVSSLLDVGCGPGLATFTLAPHFTQSQGLDPSPAMILTAQARNPSPESIAFHTSPAEDMPIIPSSSVDLLTVANAAHWFDLPKFWIEAARVLKPGGSVAIWTTGRAVPHPDLPNSDKIQAAISQHRKEFLDPYKVEGNLATRDGYKDLTWPWDIKPTPIEGFDPTSLHRRVWSHPELFLSVDQTQSLDDFEMMMGTKSTVVRWREANPEKVETDEDVVRVLRNEIEQLLREKGMSEKDLAYKSIVPGEFFILKRR